MIVFSHGVVEIDAFWTLLFLYVGLVGLFTWRVARLLQTQRAAEHFLRERLARRTALALRSQRTD